MGERMVGLEGKWEYGLGFQEDALAGVGEVAEGLAGEDEGWVGLEEGGQGEVVTGVAGTVASAAAEALVEVAWVEVAWEEGEMEEVALEVAVMEARMAEEVGLSGHMLEPLGAAQEVVVMVEGAREEV